VNQRTKKIARTIGGGLVLLIGIIAIPYPGPGWLIVFAGLAILAKDYPAAQQVLDYARDKYDQWQAWLKRQSKPVKALFWGMTFTVVVITIWLLNGYGLVNSVLRLEQPWLQSPFVR
jgi:uncharacterized protein (TIGR02611 family)